MRKLLRKLLGLMMIITTLPVAANAQSVSVPDDIADLSPKEAYIKGFNDGKNSTGNTSVPSYEISGTPSVMGKIADAKVIPWGEIGDFTDQGINLQFIMIRNDQIMKNPKTENPLLKVYFKGRVTDTSAKSITLDVMNYYLLKDGQPVLLYMYNREFDEFTDLYKETWGYFRYEFELDVPEDFRLDGTELLVFEYEDKAVVFQMDLRDIDKNKKN